MTPKQTRIWKVVFGHNWATETFSAKNIRHAHKKAEDYRKTVLKDQSERTAISDIGLVAEADY